MCGVPLEDQTSCGHDKVLGVNMDTALKMLPPSQAWEEVGRRSLAIAVAGFVFVGVIDYLNPQFFEHDRLRPFPSSQ